MRLHDFPQVGDWPYPFEPLERPRIKTLYFSERAKVEKVIFNDPATIIVWSDKTKTVVKCQEGDKYDKEIGLAMCIAKKYFGNKGNFNEIFKKWVPEDNTVNTTYETKWNALKDYVDNALEKGYEQGYHNPDSEEHGKFNVYRRVFLKMKRLEEEA